MASPHTAWLTHAGMPPPEDHKLEEEYRAPYINYKTYPSPTTTGQLLRAVDPVIQSGMKAYAGKNSNKILKSSAKKIALQAFSSYDPTQGTLKNHLLTNLQGLQRQAAKQTQMIHVPERVALEKQTLDQVEREMRDELSREPSSLEIADRTGLSLKRQKYIRGYAPGFAQGQFAAMTAGEEGDGVDPAVVQANPIVAKAELIYHDLDPVNQTILEYGFGMHGRQRLPVGQIARKLNITPGAISQRSAKIQAMLDELSDTGIF